VDIVVTNGGKPQHKASPLLNPLIEPLAIRLSTIKPCKSLVIPQAGEEANESLREFHVNEQAMLLDGSQFYNLLNPTTTLPANAFIGQRLRAIAGIGHPERFFVHLKHLGLNAQTHAFPDHHRYTVADISFNDTDAILMTEKDAVKCTAFATEQCWALRVDAQVDPALAQLIIEKIKK
jgi:tetraacyldisaccharide 4'-kinase